MIEVLGVATPLDVVLPFHKGRSDLDSVEVRPTKIRSGGVARHADGVPMLLGHDRDLEVGEVVDVWEQSFEGALVLGMCAHVWDRRGINAAWQGMQLSISASAATQTVEICEGVEVSVFERTTIEEISFVRAGVCGHRARVLSWRPLAAEGGRS